VGGSSPATKLHARCGIHAARLLAKLLGSNDSSRQALDEVPSTVFSVAGRNEGLREKLGQDFAALAANEVVEPRRVLGRVGVDKPCLAAKPRGHIDEPRGGVYGPGRPNGEEDEASRCRFSGKIVDLLEVVGIKHLAEPNDMGTKMRGSTDRAASLTEGHRRVEILGLVQEGGPIALAASGFPKGTVHLDHSLTSCLAVKTVHVLRCQEKTIA